MSTSIDKCSYYSIMCFPLKISVFNIFNSQPTVMNCVYSSQEFPTIGGVGGWAEGWWWRDHQLGSRVRWRPNTHSLECHDHCPSQGIHLHTHTHITYTSTVLMYRSTHTSYIHWWWLWCSALMKDGSTVWKLSVVRTTRTSPQMLGSPLGSTWQG